MDSLIDHLSEDEIKSLIKYNKIKANPHLSSISEKLLSIELKNIKQKAKFNTITKEVEKELSELEKQIKSYENPPIKEIPTKPIRIYIDGVFDIIHSGHFNAIRQAKKLGDILVMGVNSDADVLKVKGPTLMNENERGALAGACKWVDEVVIGTAYTPSIKLLDELKCDYSSHGDDVAYDENGVSVYDEIIKAGRMKYFKRTEGVSTTEIIGRLLLCIKDNIVKGEKDKMEMTTSSELIKQLAELDDFQKNRKPVMSSFLATSWRITEFSNNKTPKENDKIIYIDGAFDILHIGHIEALKKAKELGDFLYVGVHDDYTVNKFKGKNYPILNLNERVFNLLALKYVDEVIIASPWKVTEDMIKSLKINLVVQGTTPKTEEDYLNIKPEDDPYEIPKKLGIFQTITSNYDLSNDILIQRLIKHREAYISKYLNKAKKDEAFFEGEGKEQIKEI